MGISRTGGLVGVGVGMMGVFVWQAARVMQTNKVIRYLRFINIKTIFTTELTESAETSVFSVVAAFVLNYLSFH